MDEFVLWFNILTFTLIFAALGLNYIRLLQGPSPWRGWYLWYQGSYALWLILATYTFFKVVFLDSLPPWLDSGMDWLRIVISFVLLIIVPEFIARLKGTGWGLGRHVSAVLLLVAMMTILLFFPLPFVSGMVSGFYNLFFSILSFSALRFRKLPGDIKGFLYLSSWGYLLFALLNFFSPLLPWLSSGINTLAIGLFCGLWGLNDLYWFIRDWRLSSQGSTGLSNFQKKAEEWRLSPREQEIIHAMYRGATNKEIAEKLFVSLRTVEAHLYSIYRKAGAKNRVELMHKFHSA